MPVLYIVSNHDDDGDDDDSCYLGQLTDAWGTLFIKVRYGPIALRHNYLYK